ncbi:GILT-like protein 1 [Eumeta japonica]|uniref:GILT-like protein 1 n=1 Tax=Eumeta variegata TaxID=151549 RepID=A0A4C1UZ45_EUMVA|nr:GILT-like protein 1 [Eumeta japonica]
MHLIIQRNVYKVHVRTSAQSGTEKVVLALIAVQPLINVSLIVNMNKELYITIYYESLCPDSKDFVLNQLRPAVRYLHEYIVLRLIPFGKSKSVNGGADGFVCQHGPKECLGNRVQNCALSQMADRSDADKVAYVACEMTHKSGAHGSYACASKANISVHDVEKCVNSEEGTRLQKHSELITKLARPSFIPTVIVDGMFMQEIQDSSLIDFIATLCSMLNEIKFCAHYYNKIAMHHLLYSPLNLYTYE